MPEIGTANAEVTLHHKPIENKLICIDSITGQNMLVCPSGSKISLEEWNTYVVNSDRIVVIESPNGPYLVLGAAKHGSALEQIRKSDTEAMIQQWITLVVDENRKVRKLSGNHADPITLEYITSKILGSIPDELKEGKVLLHGSGFEKFFGEDRLILRSIIRADLNSLSEWYSSTFKEVEHGSILKSIKEHQYWVKLVIHHYSEQVEQLMTDIQSKKKLQSL